MNYRERFLIITVILLFTAFGAFGQSNAQVKGNTGDPDPAAIGVDTAQQKLKEVSVSKFEDAGFWKVEMPRDQGIITLRRLQGGPLDKEPIPDEKTIGITEGDKNVLGVKVEFFKRGYVSFFVRPERPLPVEGISKTLSMWVVGRNTNHVLVVLLSDQFGHKAEITMGKLNFTGWKKMTVAIPTTIVQRDYHYMNRQGIKIEGFRIDCDPVEAYGSYFIYLDDLRAVTDLFSEETRDVDDMMDNW